MQHNAKKPKQNKECQKENKQTIWYERRNCKIKQKK